jgi:hypothetical protein
MPTQKLKPTILAELTEQIKMEIAKMPINLLK